MRNVFDIISREREREMRERERENKEEREILMERVESDQILRYRFKKSNID